MSNCPHDQIDPQTGLCVCGESFHNRPLLVPE